MPRSKSEKKQSAAKKPSPTKKQPGLLAQAAASGAGVAVGSAVGHAVGHKLTGGGGNKPASGSGAAVQCDVEWKTFVACSEKNSDQTKCKELLKDFTDCLKMNNKID